MLVMQSDVLSVPTSGTTILTVHETGASMRRKRLFGRILRDDGCTRYPRCNGIRSAS